MMINEQIEQTMAAAKEAGFTGSETYATRGDLAAHIEGVEYIAMHLAKRDWYLRIYEDGSWQLRLPNGDRKSGQYAVCLSETLQEIW